MIKLSLKKEKFNLYVDNEEDKKGLEELARMEFTTLPEFSDKVRKYNSYVSKDWRIIDAFIKPRITGLPFSLKELPVFYSDPLAHGNNGMYIGNVEVMD